VRGDLMLCHIRRVMKVHRVQADGRVKAGSGLRKPPPSR
jgi:hypothetical protein